MEAYNQRSLIPSVSDLFENNSFIRAASWKSTIRGCFGQDASPVMGTHTHIPRPNENNNNNEKPINIIAHLRGM